MHRGPEPIEEGRGRLGFALAASAIVHGLLLLALWLAPERPHEPPAPEQEPIEVVFLEAPRPVDTPAEGGSSGAPPAGVTPAGLAPSPARSPAPSPTRSPAAPSAQSLAPSPARSPAAPSDAEGAPEGVLTVAPDEKPPPIDESLRLPRELDLRAPVTPAPDESAPPSEPIPEGRRLERRLAEIFAEDRANETARSRRDSYWLDLRQRLERGFAPPMEIVEAGPGSDSAGMRGAIDSYLAEAAAYGATGTPYGDEPLEPGGRRGFAHEVVDDVAMRVFRRPQQEAIGDTAYLSRKLVAVVEIEQGPDGSLAGTRLVSSSGLPAYDRLALGHVGDGAVVDATALGPPPPQGRRTRWAFTSTLRIVPPAPIVGCSVDAYFIPQECFYPMKKILRHRVQLLAVYDDRGG